jgi:hypothetical protein
MGDHNDRHLHQIRPDFHQEIEHHQKHRGTVTNPKNLAPSQPPPTPPRLSGPSPKTDRPDIQSWVLIQNKDVFGRRFHENSQFCRPSMTYRK